MSKHSSLALVIPSFNRNLFLERQLKFYSMVGFPYSIYIGDSSSLDTHNELKRICLKFKNLNISLMHLPSTNESVAIYKLLNQATEEYAVFAGDDDFHLPGTLERCCKFLSENLNYSVCMGNAQAFALEGGRGSINGRLVSLGIYPVYNVLDEDPIIRLRNLYITYFPTLFGVHRRLDFIEAFSCVDKFDVVSFRELAPVSYDVLKGKIKVFEELQFFRQGHDARIAVPRGIDWVLAPNWRGSYGSFEEFILSLHSGLSSSEFREIFQPYFGRVAANKKSIMTNNSILENVKVFIRRKTLGHRIKRRIKKLFAQYDSKEIKTLFELIVN